jgi:hypothetical protein
MSISIDGSNLHVSGSVRGHVFPRKEAEIAYPVLVEPRGKDPLRIEGSVYGRSLRFVQGVEVDGPTVSGGDLLIEPGDRQMIFRSGLNATEGISAKGHPSRPTVGDGVKNASLVVRGDVVGRNVLLENTVVFGSIKAVNCTLRNCVVMGTVASVDQLTAITSTLGGYKAREVQFEGPCIMVHSMGESSTRPVFTPAEAQGGGMLAPELFFYPALRERFGIAPNPGAKYPENAKLDIRADWVAVQKKDGDDGSVRDRWILSIGGRICNIQLIKRSIELMSRMLKTGFEFDHYIEKDRAQLLAAALEGLTPDETWILNCVCRSRA